MNQPNHLTPAQILDQIRGGDIPGGWAVFTYRRKAALIWLFIRVRDTAIGCCVLFALLLAFEVVPIEPMTHLLGALTQQQQDIPWTAFGYIAGLLTMIAMATLVAAYRPVRILLSGSSNVLVVTPDFVFKSLGGQTGYYPMADVLGVSEGIVERLYTGAVIHGVFGEGWHRSAVSLRLRNRNGQHRLVCRGHYGPLRPIAQHINNYVGSVSSYAASNTPD